MNRSAILKKLKGMGYGTIPEEFYSWIDNWRSWYDGNVKSFHNYTIFNGQNKVRCRRYTMGMAKKVSEDWANLLMNEKVKITLEGEKEQAFVDGVFLANNFAVKSSEMQEMKAAMGTVAYIPRIVGVVVDEESGKITSGSGSEIKLDYVTADMIFPLSWENGIATECAFGSEKSAGGKRYVYLQIHHKGDGGQYFIDNVLFLQRGNSLAEVANINEVSGFENIPARVRTGSTEPQFIIDRLNIANNVDVSIPMGIAVFANAIDQLKGVDIAYDSYVNEFVLGKKRIIVKPEATKNMDGEPIFDPNDTVYYVLPEDVQGGTLVDEVDMTLRTQEHNAGMQDMLSALSAKCGFGENHYKYDRGSVSTATQIISENSTQFRTIKKHEIILEDVLVDLCRLILRLGNAFMSAGLKEDVEISIDFDDSIIEDKETEFNRDARMVSMGIMNAWEFRAKWMNEDEKTAKAALPGMESLVDGA